MRISVELPDDLARQMIPDGHEPARTALEDMAVEAYRARRLTEHQLATLLGMGRYELDGFLKRREMGTPPGWIAIRPPRLPLPSFSRSC